MVTIDDRTSGHLSEEVREDVALQALEQQIASFSAKDSGVAGRVMVDDTDALRDEAAAADPAPTDHRRVGVEHHAVSEHRRYAVVLAHGAVLVEHQVVAVGRLGQDDADRVTDEEDFGQLDLVEAINPVQGLVQQEQAGADVGGLLVTPDGVGQVVQEDAVL